MAYDSDGTARIAWRTPDGCALAKPLVSASGMWFGAQGESATYFYQSYDEAVGLTLLQSTRQSQWQAGSGALFALEVLGAGTVIIEGTSQPPVEAQPGSKKRLRGVYESFVTFLQFQGLDSAEGWLWRSDGFVQVAGSSGNFVVDLLSDGERLVWVVMDELEQPSSAELWASVVAPDGEFSSPQKVDDVPPYGSMSSAGDGHYAYVDRDGLVHVYRLDDGSSWTLPMPFGTTPVDLPYVDSRHVMLQGVGRVFRVPFSDLPAD